MIKGEFAKEGKTLPHFQVASAAFISRATMRLILQGVYDECGLKGSTAVHMWIDTVISVLDYMYCCGVENDHTFSIKCKIKL